MNHAVEAFRLLRHTPWVDLRDSSALGIALWTISTLGCSAVVNPDQDRLGPLVDADLRPRLMDSGSGDPDAGRPPPPRRDAGMGGCSISPRCEMDVRVFCDGDVLSEEDCQQDESFCSSGSCVPWRCDPGEIECVDGASAVCNERGSGVDTRPCPGGRCDPDTGECFDEPPPPPGCPGAIAIGVGDDDEIDLCEYADERVPVRSDSCANVNADLGDLVYALEIEETQEVVIELTDIDPVVAIDTLIYLRRSCDDSASQFACADDVACGASTVPGGPRCSGDVDVRQSRMRVRLEPGTYFLIVDGFDYTRNTIRYQCGNVRLEVREA